MKKVDILIPPHFSKSNQGYAIYVEGRKVWESTSQFNSSKGEKIKIDDFLTALGFKMHVVEITDKVIDNNYGIFPDGLDELSKYGKEEKFEKDKLEKAIPGDEYDFDTIYFPDMDLDEDDSKAYDSNYDLQDFENQEVVDWVDIEDFYEDDDDLDF